MKKIALKLLVKAIGLYINMVSYVHTKKSLQLAYNLFSQPQKGKLKKDKLPKSLAKATQEQLQHNEHLFYLHKWKGNEEIILLVHGWESNASRWKKLLPYLKQTGKTILAIDGPAHGLTSGKEFNVPLYGEFIHKVVQQYQPKIVIGHSIGGNAIAYFQAHYPQNFEKMVLIGAPSDFNVILNNYISMLSLNSNVHQQLIRYTTERFNVIIDEFSASNFLKNTTIPGIIAHDINDDVVCIDEAKKIANAWKTAQFIETKGLGHSMHNDELYQTIIEFIQ
jgi:esterase/lipase